ncbi:hypothetical protein AB0L70_07460 [Kribbella sp. NPDC051952]|uniref:hypothetical protein n=1 Tax=Kribbella sp. NPDC051952 TaxID=3154851 RepID=UPI003440F725
MDDVGAELRRLAGQDPLGPIDAHALLDRSRRGRRRRRLLSAGGGIAGVAAVVIAASLLPNLNTADNQPAVSGTQPAVKTATPGFTPVPGAPRGEEGINQKLSYAEASRRCALRYPGIKRSIQKNSFWYSGDTVRFELKAGDHDAMCTIPGADKPSAGLVAAARRDPMPATAAGQLRNCSVLFWTDLTKWRILTSETEPGRAISLTAMSPSGRSVVNCNLAPAWQDFATPFGSGPRMLTVADFARQAFDKNFSVSGGQVCQGRECEGWLFVGQGRVASNIAKIRIESKAGVHHDVKVVDGWYSVAWLNNDPQGRPDGKVTAYDKNGNVLKVLPA